MPLYEFQASSGDKIERYYPVAERPEFGQAIKVKGKVYRRVISLVAHPVAAHSGLIMGFDLPPNDPRAPRHTKDGVCVFTSANEAREYCAKTDGDMKFDRDAWMSNPKKRLGDRDRKRLSKK